MKISLLGPVEVRADDGTLIDLGGARLRTLLIRMAVEPERTVSYDALIDAVWRDEPPANAANALQQLVSRLRRRGVPVQADATGYSLQVPPDDIEVNGPWRGPALADVADSPWAAPYISRLTEQRVAAAQANATSVAELEALVAEHPLREPPVELLMRALWAQGRAAEALAAYENYRSRIADELGADPSPALSRLHVEILRSPEPPAQRLPLALTSFVGREEDLAHLRELLDTARLTTLIGPGGSGKTRLALETARPLPDTRLVELAPLTSGAEVAPALLAALGVREHQLLKRVGSTMDSHDPLDRVIAALSHQRTLLILDNCEHLLDAVAQLAEAVLSACPGVSVLATSREPLGLIGETLWPVEPLAEESALRLLVDRATASKPGFRLPDNDLGPRLCHALDGMPLAIELAAARLRTMSLEQLTDRLNDRFRLLTGGSRTALPRHQTLRAVVDWSWELCGDAEREVWRVLSVFHGGATLSAMEALAGPDAFEVLSALADKSLVRVEGDRYSMLETIREYGLAQLDDPARLERGHAAYFTGLAEQAEPHLREQSQLEWLTLLRADHDNLHSALRRSIAMPDTATALRLVAALGWYWWLSGYRAEGSSLAAETLTLPYDGTTLIDKRARAYTVAALNVVEGQGDLPQAKVWFEKASELVKICGTVHPILKLVAPTSLITSWDITAAKAVLPAYAELFEDPDPWVAGTARSFYAHTLVNIGNSGEEAKENFEIALSTFRAVGDRWGMSLALEALSMMEAQEGDFPASAARAQEAIDLLNQLGTTEDLLQLRMRLAHAQYRQGETETSLATLREAERLSEQHGAAFGRAAIAFAWANLARLNGDFAEARRLLDHATELIAQPIVAGQFRAVVAGSYGLLAGELGDLELARQKHAEALQHALSSADSPVIGHVLVGCADLSLREGKSWLAATLLGAAEAMNGAVDHSILDLARIEAETLAALGKQRYVAAYREGQTATTETVPALTGLSLAIASSSE